MAANLKLRSDDKVKVVSGRAKGAEGEILTLDRETNRVTVSGVNLVKKHARPGHDGQGGGIVEKEATIHASNVMAVDENGATSRIGYRFEDGKKKRYLKTTGNLL